jgi:Fe-S cluster assembly scaffold protein SufB
MLKIETDGKAVIKKFSDYDFLSEYHKKLIKEEHNEKDFSSIEKHVIIIPKNQKANVKINYNIESSQFSHIIIILEENSTAEITETLESSEASKLNTALTEIFLKENSQLEFKFKHK